MASLKQILTDGDHFARENGCRLIEIREGYARAELTVETHHLNAAGVCQGGVYFTLADITFAAVMNSHKQVTVGVQNSITYLRSAHLGDTLIAETEETCNHHRLPFCETHITNQHGELLCIVTGSAYRKKDSFEYEGLE
ncbi:MAG: hotdog fold thioesterase [Prevotella sp.]|nr:hotdog fold thioesterase [Prevotella sp.]